jgi:hypothetical protein
MILCGVLSYASAPSVAFLDLTEKSSFLEPGYWIEKWKFQSVPWEKPAWK